MRIRVTSDEFTDDDIRPYVCVVLANGDEVYIVNRKQAALLPAWASDLHWNEILETADNPKIAARRRAQTAEIVDINDLRARRAQWREQA